MAAAEAQRCANSVMLRIRLTITLGVVAQIVDDASGGYA
jgi:hypothetical protein